MKQMKKIGESWGDEKQNPRRLKKKNHFLTSCHYYIMVKTYLCHHKNRFKVKDKVAALQIQELWTDGTHDVLEWQNHRGVFVKEVQLSILWTYLHQSYFGATYSRLSNASWEVSKDSSGLAQPSWPNQHQLGVWAAHTSFTANKCCCVTTIWFEDRGCVVAPVHAEESTSMRSQHAQAPSSQFCCLFP